MKQEDFERLKAVCEKEGFELLKSLPDKDTNFHILAVSKKDIWDGVEFVDRETTHWPVCKITKIQDNRVYYLNSDGDEVHIHKGDLKPSTESAYIEQLKKEANKRGVLDIVSLDISMMDGGQLYDRSTEYIYRKDTDTLYFHGVPVYQQGKWATRVKERVKVEPISGQFFQIDNTVQFKFKTINMNGLKGNITEFLASQLEKYLNGEVE